MKAFFIVLSCLPAWMMFLVPASAGAVVVTDMANREVTVPFDPNRILCIGPGALRLVVYLQAENRVVGVEDMEKMNPGGRPYWIAHPELHRLPRCGPGGPAGINKKPDLETLLSLAPDVVFVTYMEGPLADEVTRTLGIPLVVLSYGAFATFDEAVYDALRVAGKVLNRENRAREVVAYIESLRKDLAERTGDIPQDRRPEVYVGGIGYRGAHGIESTEQRFVPFDWVNATNVAQRLEADVGTHVFVDKEMLLSLDPEAIFIDGGGVSVVKKDYENKTAYYSAFKAFKTGRVYTLHPFNWYTTNIGTALADAYAVGKILYADRFQEIDPETKTDDIYEFFVGKRVHEAMKRDYGPIGGKAPFLP